MTKSAPSRFAPLAERLAFGRSLKGVVRRVDQDAWSVPSRRRSVLDLVRESERGRIATDLRGAALVD